MSRRKKYTVANFVSDVFGVLLIVLGIYMLSISNNEFAVKLMSIAWGDKSVSLVGLLVVAGVLTLLVPRAKAVIDVYAYWKQKKNETPKK